MGMGYTTEFEGSFVVAPPLAAAQVAYLKAFSETRRMRRNAAVAATLPDPNRSAIDLEIGDEAEFFVGGTGLAGQDRDASVIDFNRPPSAQPGMWCQWIPSDDGTEIKWDGGEKFYYYTEWMNYIIDRFLTRWGRAISGEVSYQGEDRDDRGLIVIKDGRAVAVADVITRGRA